jgi:hypothetical protein
MRRFGNHGMPMAPDIAGVVGGQVLRVSRGTGITVY